MYTELILRLEAEQRESKLKYELAEASRKIKAETLQAQINIISTHVTIMSMAAFAGVK